MTDLSRLLLIERVLPDNPRDDLFAYLQDLNMLHSLSGRERSEAEFSVLLGRSGFRLSRIVRTQSPFAVIDGQPAKPAELGNSVGQTP
jgi:O-methyltransferase